ncbi:hypothetical protein C1645_761533, partial [Glomus cerebriforme]
MLRFIASFVTSNIKLTTTFNSYEENSRRNVYVTSTGFNNPPFTMGVDNESTFDETEQSEDLDIQSLRQQKLQELAKKILLRKISHQAVLDHYAQDHLPLSQIREKLEEDDLPLNLLQDKLKQKNDLPVYTTIRENINFLLYSKPSKSKKLKSTLTTLITDETNKSSNDDNTTRNIIPKDDRDYDVWDDAIIGRLMNLIDTIGMETIQEEISEGRIIKETTSKEKDELMKQVVKEVIREAMREDSINESPSVDYKEHFTIPEKSTEITLEKEDEIKVVESSATSTVDVKIENNDVAVAAVVADADSIDIEIENNTVTVADDADDAFVVENNVVENNVVENIQESIQEETKLESIKLAEEIIDFGETINVADSLFPSKIDTTLNNYTTKSNSKKRHSRLGIPIPKSLKTSDLNRKCSIHSKKSYDNISRRSSISSKFSVNTTTGVIFEQDEDFKFHNKFLTTSKRTTSTEKSNKSLQFLRSLWKNNQNLPINNNSKFLS